MNYKKLLVLFILIFAVIGFTMGSVSAKSTTMKIPQNKDVGKGDRITTLYQAKDGQLSKGVYISIFYHNKKLGDDYRPHTYVLQKAVVYYKNSKGKVITRTAKANTLSGHSMLSTKKISNYKPYKVVVSYRKMTSKEKSQILFNPLY